MEIEHLKTSNMMEVQKIEEIKQDIEKSKNMKIYIETEINELEEKLKSFDVESNQKEMEYNIQKNDLEEKLKNLKVEISNEKSILTSQEAEFVKVIILFK